MFSIRCVLALSLSWSTTVIAQQTLRYDFPVGDKFGYKIRASVTYDGREYLYSGFAQYEVLERNEDGMKLRFRGRLGGQDIADRSRERDSLRELRAAATFIKGRADRDHDFPGMVEQEQVFQISSRGMIQESAAAKPLALPFYMGDLRTIAFEPLGDDGSPFWEVTRSIPIGSIKKPKPKPEKGPARLGEIRLADDLFPFENYERFDLSPATETRRYRTARPRRGVITISRTDEVMSTAVKMSFAGVGQAEWMLEAKTAKPISLTAKRQIKVTRDGALETATAELSYKLSSAEELDQYHAAVQKTLAKNEANRQANLAAAEKRREEAQQKEASRKLTRKEIADMLLQLDSNGGFDRDKALRFLAEHPMAKRSRQIVHKLRQLRQTDDFRYRRDLKKIEEAWGIDLDD
jgi:hypothetical protein